MTTATRVLIVGGGPAGLVIAIELGRRGVPCVLFDLGREPPKFPKANSSTSRTMEHFRRLGDAAEIRSLGLPPHYPPDISYHTRYAEWELARRRWPSWDEISANPRPSEPRWPTPEPMHRGQQTRVEEVLRRRVAQFPCVETRYGWRVAHIQETPNGVTCAARQVDGVETATFSGDFLVGCDAARSIVRQTLGIDYEGVGSEDREFLGGRMLATWLRMPEFYEVGPRQRSWQYWAMNPERFGALVAIDGQGEFVLHTQLPKGVSGGVERARESIDLVMGRKIEYEILGVAEWMAGYMLVAKSYGSQRMFLVGDAAHLFTPAAGLGYNTSVDDAANLGWKLAAVCQGWGGPKLLESYELERRPIAQRNTSFARNIADYFRTIKMPAALEQKGREGETARAEFAIWLNEVGEREFDAPGIHFGVFYGGSPTIEQEPGPPPPDDPHWYEPHARPGARAPHVWLGDRLSIFDRLGRDFTLLKFDPNVDTSAFDDAASTLGAPLDTVLIEDPAVHDLYGASLVLVRPDQHIAWRGDATPSDPRGLLAKVSGF